MPFKSGQSFTHINKKLDKVINDIDGKMQDRALYAAATVGLGYATLITSIDTSNLVNSRFISSPSKTLGGSFITCGYTANYAIHVHDFKGTPTPKPRPDGNGLTWDPNGEPYFLLNGFEQNMAAVTDTFYKAMRL